jgi:hypothetical protein
MPAPDAALGESTAPPVCRHWSRTGTCLYAERCRFLHPPDRRGVDAYDPSNKPVERSDEKGDPERGTQGRRRVRKRGKCGFLRRFMLDTFGLERLRRGVVLDVGGGNGELSFELENLNDVRCVVVDPQRIAVRKLEVKLRGGWYHRTAPLQRYNTAPPPPAVEGTREEREQRIAKQIEQTDGPSVSGPSGWRPRRPMHWRVLWSPALWMDGGGGGESGADVVALYNAWAAARVIRFRPSRGDEDPALPSSRSSPGGDGTHERDGEKITNALRTLGTFGDGDPGDKKSAPGEETAPEEDECECAGCGDLSDDDVGSCALFPPSVDAVRHALRTCSAVVGLHSDHATEWIVDFALKFRIPFAVVPCCVCPTLFPERRTSTPAGRCGPTRSLWSTWCVRVPLGRLGLGGSGSTGRTRSFTRRGHDDIRRTVE